MEPRKITIVSSKTQKNYVVETAAETLGELKEALRANNIDFTDMAFMEGLTKSELKSDESPLPKDVQRTNRVTGETYTTNELVFMLTNSEKKIKSGSARSDLYAEIKERNLQDAIKETFGKNFTQVSSEALTLFMYKYKVKPQECSCEHCDCEEDTDNVGQVPNDTEEETVKTLSRKFNSLVIALVNEEILPKSYINLCNWCMDKESKLSSPYSQSEIDDMFNF